MVVRTFHSSISIDLKSRLSLFPRLDFQIFSSYLDLLKNPVLHRTNSKILDSDGANQPLLLEKAAWEYARDGTTSVDT